MPKISSKKLARLRSAAGRKLGPRAAGQRGAALQVVAGAVAGIAHSAATSRVQLIGKNWWSGPVLLAVAGIAANRSARLRGVGNALLGAAGYSGYMAYTVQAANKPAQTSGFEEQETGLIGGGFQSYRAPFLDQPARVPVLSAPNPGAQSIPVSSTIETIGLN